MLRLFRSIGAVRRHRENLAVPTSTDDRSQTFTSACHLWQMALKDVDKSPMSVVSGVEVEVKMRRGDIADLVAFVTVADLLSFRAAASRLAITPSALSHTIRQLEQRLGIRLLNRTTRSVSLTDAGHRLLERLRPAIVLIHGALEDVNLERQRPFGRLRIYAGHFPAAGVIAPVWGRFLTTYPEVDLELRVDEGPIDIVAKGFDAGIGPREWAAADMVAVRVMGPMKVVVVGAPAYLSGQRPPNTPDDLALHRCIQYRQFPDGPVKEWTLERNGQLRRISPGGRITVSNPELAVRAAVDGLGLAYTLETLANVFLRSGQLVQVLQDWSPCFKGLFFYYPRNRQVPAALRALIEMVRTTSGEIPAKPIEKPVDMTDAVEVTAY